MTTSGASKSSAAILAHARKVEKPSTPLLLPGDVLPFPTNAMPDPSKKSHAKKQPPGHIPRPRNAFILFRCDFVRQKKIPNTVENDHRNISRIAGTIWRGMNDQEREPWVVMAQEEKRRHQQNHPNYRFNPGQSGRKRVKRGDDVPQESQPDESVVSSIDRAASAPPGALRIPQVNVELLNGYGNPLRTRDDLSRRPSRVTLYQSKPFDVNGQTLTDPDFFSDIVNQHYFSQAVVDNYLRAVSDTSSETVGKNDEQRVEECANGIFCGPRLDLEPHSLYDRDYPPDWQPAPTEQPIAWNNYSDLVVESVSEVHLFPSFKPYTTSGWGNDFKLLYGSSPCIHEPIHRTISSSPSSRHGIRYGHIASSRYGELDQEVFLPVSRDCRMEKSSARL